MKFWLVHLGKSFVFIASSQNKTILFQSMQKQRASYVVKKSLTVYLYQAYSTHRRSCMNYLIHTHKKRWLMRFLSLLHFEWKRVSKVYFFLFGLVSAIQLIAIYVLASTQAAHFTNEALITNVSLEQIAESYSIRWEYLYSELPIIGSIMMAIAIMLVYSLLIWYRDWLGKNNVITRLLMLPINRAQLFAAKLFLLFLSFLV